jgi:flavin-dependent dehydrogenase
VKKSERRTADFDLLVIGAGPAGCAAAIAGSGFGLRVAIADRGQPRSRVPESLHPGALDLLAGLGLRDERTFCCGPAYRRVASGWLRPGSAAPAFDGAEAIWRGRHVDRTKLDAALLSRMERMGVEILDRPLESLIVSGRRVQGGMVGGNSVRAAICIDASGTAQFARRQLGIGQRILSAPLICSRGVGRIDLDTETSPVLTPTAAGWTWIAPLRPGLAVWSALRSRSEVEKLQWPTGLTPIGIVEQKARTWRVATEVAGPGYIMAGEAGGTLDPASGDGVVLALESGRNAAITAARIVGRPSEEQRNLRSYADWWQNRILRKARALALAYVTAGLGRLLQS